VGVDKCPFQGNVKVVGVKWAEIEARATAVVEDRAVRAAVPREAVSSFSDITSKRSLTAGTDKMPIRNSSVGGEREMLSLTKSRG